MALTENENVMIYDQILGEKMQIFVKLLFSLSIILLFFYKKLQSRVMSASFLKTQHFSPESFVRVSQLLFTYFTELYSPLMF